MKKSLLVTIFSLVIAIIAGYSSYASPTLAAWLGIISFSLTTILSTWFPSGDFIGNNWSVGMWILNAGGVFLQIWNLVAQHNLVPAQIVTIVIIAVNIIIQQFGKTYKTV